MGLHVPQKYEGIIKAFVVGLLLLLGVTTAGFAAPAIRIYIQGGARVGGFGAGCAFSYPCFSFG